MQTNNSAQPFNILRNSVNPADVTRLQKAGKSSATPPQGEGDFKSFIKGK